MMRSQSISFYILGFMLIFAPIFRASNLPLPLMVLQWCALILIALFILEPKKQLPRRHWLGLGLLLFLPLFSLIPIPYAIWSALPGRADYAQLWQLIDIEPSWHSLSLITMVSEYALWTLLVPIAVYIATLHLSREQILKLVYIMLAMGSLQAILGLMQVGQGNQSPLYFGSPYRGAATGTYYNRDHFAGLLEMIFPIALALLAAKVGHAHRHRRFNFWLSLQGHQAVIYGAITVLLLLAIIFTQSRMGIAMLMLGLFLALLLFFRRLGGDQRFGVYGSIIAIVLVLAIEIGLVPILDRFSTDLMEDLRWPVWITSMQGVADFAPIGSGAGTYPYVYPKYQPLDIFHFVNHAHNDYLEWSFNHGLLAIAVILFLLWLYFRQWSQIKIQGRWGLFRFVQAGAGIGLFLIILHSVVDFNLHKPANAVYFAFLAGIFMRHNREEALRKQARKKRTPKMTIEPMRPPERTPEDDEFLKDW